MLKKSILFICIYLQAGMLNYIALTVNDEAITMFDIDALSQKHNISKNKATEVLISRMIYNQALENLHISTNQNEITQYVRKLAKSNHLGYNEFLGKIKQQNIQIGKFRDDIKKQVLNQKLLAIIAKGKLNLPTIDEVETFYNENKSKLNSTLEESKNRIMNILMQKKEEEILKSYLEKNRILADIEIIE